MTTTEMETMPFPAAVGLTHLRVYDTAATDGVVGGSPHMHLASAEAYIPIAGTGEVQTLSASGETTFPLQRGTIVWFEPGVIHRLVNSDRQLELLVIMQNAGLPEAGDAVFTFPDDIMSEPLAYLTAASLEGATEEERIGSALRRRDRAVTGFHELLQASRSGDDGPLRNFFERATALKREQAPGWESLIEGGPVRAAHQTEDRLAQLHQGSVAGLLEARVRTGGTADHGHNIGMCGLLQAYEPVGFRV